MSRIKIWNRVPNGSTLSIAVDSPDTVTAEAFLTVSDGEQVDWDDGDLRPGPVETDLETPKLYSVVIDLKYATAASGTVNAEITQPGGGKHSDAFSVTVPGAAGDVQTVTIGVVTLQS